MKLTSQMPSSTSLMPSFWPASTVEMLIRLRCRQSRPKPSRLSLGGSGRAPEGTEISAIGIKLQHLVVELPRGFSCVIQPDEVANVLAGFFDISLTIVVARNLVSGDNRRRFQSVDFFKCGNPFQSGLPVRFAEKWMNAVVDDVASDDQSDGRDVKKGRIVGVCLTGSDNDQFVSFQFNFIAFQRIRDRNNVWKARKLLTPIVQSFRGDLKPHFRNNLACRKCLHVWEAILQNL